MDNIKFYKSKTIINLFVILMFICLAIVPVGCMKDNKDSAHSNGTYNVTDFSGAKLKFTQKPQRIISMSISTDEILIDLVGTDRIAGFSRLVDVPGISNVVERARAVKGRVHSGNVENIISLKPDLIIAPDFTPIELIQTIRDMGIKVYFYKTPHTMNEIKNTIRDLADAVGEKSKADIMIAKMDEKLNMVKSKTGSIGYANQKRVIHMDTNGAFFMPNSSFSNICKDAGVRDVTQELGYDKNCILSQEEIVRLNPDVFVLADWNYDGKHDASTMKNELIANPSYKTTNAGKNKAVVSIPAAKLLSLSQFTADAVVDVAKAVYPERF